MLLTVGEELMPAQLLMAEVRCRYTSVYIDIFGRVYIGREMERTQKITLPNTSIADISSTNLCKAKTSRFGYTLPPFGCNNAGSSTDSTTNTRTPRSYLSEEDADSYKHLISSPAYLRGLFVDMTKAVPRHVSSLFGLTAVPLIPAMITLDIASGRDPWHATAANTIGFTAGYGASGYAAKAAGVLIKHLPALRVAGRTAMMGARVGNVAGALAGFIAGIIAYSLVSDQVYEILDSPSKSSDWGYYGYDDWFIRDPYER